jgi:excisionase family DNA binding protein
LNQPAINELMNKMGEILTVAEVAILLRLHPTTVYRLVKRGDLPGFKIGDNWRISSDALELWILQLRRNHLPVSKIGR